MAKEGRCRCSVSLLAGLSFMLSGCGAGVPPTMPTWAAKAQPYVPTEGSSNAYDAYALIGRNVEEAAPDLLDRVYFDPHYRNLAMTKVARPLALLVSATAKPCEFRFSPTPVFTALPYQRGWRLLGRVLTWNIRKACVEGSYDQAITYAIAATKFGFDLTGGCAMDASLGFEITDEARRAIAPDLPKMGAAQLERLAAGLKNALEAKPSLKVTIENEHQRMLAGVQYVQDAYVAERFDDLMKMMKEDVRDGVAYLRDMRGQDGKKRPEYFEGFVAEADQQTKWLERLSEEPASLRRSEPGPTLAKQRPWRSFAKQFFTAAEPLLGISDATVARTKLAILTCHLWSGVKASQSTPKNLDQWGESLTLDPFTGRTFAYRGSGSEFDVYSLGADGVDDGGETDENFAAPDLRLEQR